MKKKIAAICLCAALFAVAVIGGTIAYFTDQEEAVNVFTVGNVDITLDEAAVKLDETTGNYIADTAKGRVQTNTYEDIFPGQSICKDPTITNVGSYAAYVRADIVIGNDALKAMHCYDETAATPFDGFKTVVTGGDVMSCTDYVWSEDADNGIADGFINDNYLLAFTANTDGTTTFTIYVLNALAEDEAVVLFDTITVPAEVTSEDFGLIIGNGGFAMKITASAIQAKGFEDAKAAFAALELPAGEASPDEHINGGSETPAEEPAAPEETPAPPEQTN